MDAEPNASLRPGSEKSSLEDESGENCLPELLRQIRARTPARLLLGRAGGSYRTRTQLELREAHAAARDAVRTELDFVRDLGAPLVDLWKLFEVRTQAADKDEYLLRPDLGRRFNSDARSEILRRCPTNVDLQIAIGDGLSVAAIRTQVPLLLPQLMDGAANRGWTTGQPFVVRHCRVGILNEIGDLLSPKVVILLIGERPGLATSESLSAYLAYEPKLHDTDADRNLISNIHGRGLEPRDAAARILNFCALVIAARRSGCEIQENSFLAEHNDILGQ